MSMMQTTNVAQGARQLRDALDAAFPKITPQQAPGVSVHTSVKRLGHDAAVAHAMWTIRSIEQDVTDNCLVTATSSMLWLQEFLEVNGLGIDAETPRETQVFPVLPVLDALGQR